MLDFLDWYIKHVELDRLLTILFIVAAIVPFFPVIGFWLLGLASWGFIAYGFYQSVRFTIKDYLNFKEDEHNRLLWLLKK